jgi:DNA-binding NtrC family response regulator
MDRIPTILVVDDDQVICDFVGEVLTEDGYIYEYASNANEALSKILKYRYDIALLDIILPGKSGLDLLEESRQLFQTTSTIMMTAIKDLGIAVKAMKLGALDYMVKPFTAGKLTDSINEVLKKKKQNSVFSQTEKTEDNDRSRDYISHSANKINAIALGVEAQLDHFDFHAKIVTEKTINIAQQLGFSAKEIEEWKTIRNKQYSERLHYINTAMDKLAQNVLAQTMLGLTNSITKFIKVEGEQN